MTPDSVTDGEYSVAGWNRYMYCHGNPVVYKDPSGHFVDEKLLEALTASSTENAVKTSLVGRVLPKISKGLGSVGIYFALETDCADATMNKQRIVKICEILEDKNATVDDLKDVMMKPLPDDQQKKKNRNSVNIDTNIIETLATDQKSKTLDGRRRQISDYLENNEKVISMTALSEIFNNSRERANASEKIKVAIFLSDTRIVQDTIRTDIMNVDVPELGSRDRIILSTGANLNIPTITHDQYMKSAAGKVGGVKVKKIKNPSGSFTGKTKK